MSPTVSREDGFRLRCAFRIHVFESGAIDHSATSPVQEREGVGFKAKNGSPKYGYTGTSWGGRGWRGVGSCCELVLMREHNAKIATDFGGSVWQKCQTDWSSAGVKSRGFGHPTLVRETTKQTNTNQADFLRRYATN